MKQRFVSVVILFIMNNAYGLEFGDTCTPDDNIFVHSKVEILVERSRPPVNVIWQDEFDVSDMMKCQTMCHLEQKCKSAVFNKTDSKCMLKDISRMDINIKITVTPGVEYFEKVPQCGTKEKFIAMVDEVTDCKDIYDKGWRQSGIYAIPISGERAKEPVVCEMGLFGGGWTVIQSRVDGSVPFNKDWNTYKEGFGKLGSNFWYGNERIHQLTWTPDSEILFELVWPSRTGGDVTYYPAYHEFKIDNEGNKYRLTITQFEDMDPSVGGTFAPFADMAYHNNQLFGTIENDCSPIRGGSGWWWDNCSRVSLNGEYGDADSGVTGDNGIVWDSITYNVNLSPQYTYLKKARMMVRRK